MANSRLERIGTIYSRITGLLRSEALKPENKPIWYDVYQHFPPKYPPRFDRPVPNIEVPPIFYPEDDVRARISKEKPTLIGSVNLQDYSRQSNAQKCIAYYEELKGAAENEDVALERAIERVASEMPMRREQPSAPPSLADEFKLSQGINVADIFKKD